MKFVPVYHWSWEIIPRKQTMLDGLWFALFASTDLAAREALCLATQADRAAQELAEEVAGPSPDHRTADRLEEACVSAIEGVRTLVRRVADGAALFEELFPRRACDILNRVARVAHDFARDAGADTGGGPHDECEPDVLRESVRAVFGADSIRARLVIAFDGADYAADGDDIAGHSADNTDADNSGLIEA